MAPVRPRRRLTYQGRGSNAGGTSLETAEELARALQTHNDEMERCAKNGCYWALLHLIVVVPDICAALENPSGTTSGNAYINWCGRYLDQTHLTSKERYGMRCGVLHQSRTEPHGPRPRYDSFKFGGPGINHLRLQGRVLSLDVTELKGEMQAAIGKWCNDANVLSGTHVSANTARLAVEEGSDLVIPALAGQPNLILPGGTTGGQERATFRWVEYRVTK